MIFRDQTHDRDLRLSQVEAQRAMLLYESVVKDRRGRIIFISGEEGIGKSDILQVLADTFGKAQPHPLLIAGRFRNSSYYSWNIGQEEPFPTDEAFAASGESLSSVVQMPELFSILAQLIPPDIKFAVDFIGQALQTLGATRQFIGRYRERHQKLFSRDDFKTLIRDASQGQPLIYLLDDLHKASYQWNTLLLEIATEIASKVPVVIFLTLVGPKELGEHTEGESNLLFLARKLVKEGLADWWSVNPLSREDVAGWLGQSAPGMIDQLRGVTGGNTKLLISLWKDWQYQNVVCFSEQEDRWIWSSNRSPSMDLFKNVLEDRIKVLLKSAGWDESKELKPYDEIRRLLSCAALEGSVFTAKAVARALNQDEDEMIDFLDDVLVQSAERPLGILKEVEKVTIKDLSQAERTLWRYSFVSLLYVAAAREFRIKEERANLALALAHSLIESYSPEEKQIASTLAWLFKIGGNNEASLHFQRMTDYAGMREGLYQHALYMLKINKDDWDEWACCQVAFLFLEAGRKMRNAYPHEETLAVFEEAYKMSLRGRLRFEQALSNYYCGMLNTDSGNYPEAKEQTSKALVIFQQMNYRAGEAGGLHQLGSIDLQLGSYESARKLIEQSLEIRQEIGDRAGETASLHHLGLIDLQLGSYESAREFTSRELEIVQEIGNRVGEAGSLHQLGSIDLELGNYESARELIEQSLEIDQEIGDRAGEAASLHHLGLIDLQLGSYESAREFTSRELEINQEIGNRAGEAGSLHQLGSIDLQLGNYESAREFTSRELEIVQEIGNRVGEAGSLHQLGSIDLELGNYESARELIEQSLEINQEIGNRAGEAGGLHQLGSIDLQLGNYESARELIEQSLGIRQEIRDRAGEAASLHQLGSIDLELGNYESARGFTMRALEIVQEIGNRTSEAANLYHLELIEELATGNKSAIKTDKEGDQSEDEFDRGSRFE